MIPEQRPIEQPAMASAPEPQYGMPWNNYPPYINPYQSFPNPMNVQVESGIQVPFQTPNIFESRQSYTFWGHSSHS